jgi:CubicO group peptidase (beta-lactamase class C family)
MRVAGRSLAWCALALTAIACGDATAPTPPLPTEPIDLSAEWAVSSPDAEGIDAAGLQTALGHGTTIGGLRSILIIRHGHLVAERYFAGAPPDSLYAIRSVTKSVISLLVGIAIQRGDIRGIAQPLGELFRPPLPTLHAADGAITVGNLLTMTGGFEWNEGANVSEYNNWALAPDQIEYLLARPLVSPPGTSFNYNSAAVHLLSAVLQVNAGGTAAFADMYLLGPLGIHARDWELDNRGIPNGGAGLYLRPRDLAKLGQLVLQRGRSGTSVVVPQSWIDQSTRRQGAAHGFLGELGALEYGNLWWLGQTAGHDVVLGWGYGGQLLYIVPDLDLVVATTARWQGLGTTADGQTVRIADLLVGEITPAVH